MSYVYLHRKTKDDSIFYVGKGSGNRLNEHRRRNKHWNSVTKNNDWYAEKVMDHLTDSEAYELEELVIETIGLNNLTNVNPGGEGMPKGTKPWNKGLSKHAAPQLSRSGAPKGNTNKKGYKKPNCLSRVAEDLDIPLRTARRWLNDWDLKYTSKKNKNKLDAFKSHPIVVQLKKVL